jgi:predicted dehydrogenase
MQASSFGINIFVEKPFSHDLRGFEEFRDNILNKKLLFFVSFQRRFHKFIFKIKEVINSGKIGKIISVRIDVASYVPNWHPYEDFHDLYACRKDLGGGVLLTEIHEIDLCYQFFGMPKAVFCSGGNYSEFDLDIEDTVNMILRYEGFNVNLSLCFMEKDTCRTISMSGTKGTLKCDLDLCSLNIKYYNNNKDILLTDSIYTMNDLFYDQADYFLNIFKISDVQKELDAAYASLAIVEACKQSMHEYREIQL